MNIKKKIFMYAIAAPVLLAVFGCENKCAPATENPALEQTAAAKVDRIWKEMTKSKPDMAVVAKMIKADVKDAETAKLLAKKMDPKKGNFFCVYFDNKMEKEPAEAVGQVVGLLLPSEAKDYFGKTCKKDDGTEISPLEKLTDGGRSTSIADDQPSLDSTIALVVEKTPSAIVQPLMNDPAKMKTLVVAGSKGKNSDVVLKKLQRSVPAAKQKDFNREAAAAGADSLTLGATIQDVLDEARKGAGVANTASVKGLFNDLLKNEKVKITTLVVGNNFLQDLVALPANPDTLAIWDSVKKNVEVASFRIRMGIGAPPVNFLHNLLDRGAIVGDDPASLRGITKLVVTTNANPADAQGWFDLVANDQSEVDNFIAALVDDAAVFDVVYQNIDFSAPIAKRPTVLKAIADHGKLDIVKQVVRAHIHADKISLNDLNDAAIAGAPDAELVKGLYFALVHGDAAGNKWQQLKAVNDAFPVALAKLSSNGMLPIWTDMVTQEKANTNNVMGNVINKAGGPLNPFELVITDPRPPTAAGEVVLERSKVIAFLIEQGDNDLGLLVNNQDKVNITFNAIASSPAYFAKQALKIVSSRMENVPFMAVWVTADFDGRLALARALTGSAAFVALLTDQYLVNAAHDAANPAAGIEEQTREVFRVFFETSIKKSGDASAAALLRQAVSGNYNGAPRTGTLAEFLSKIPANEAAVTTFKALLTKFANYSTAMGRNAADDVRDLLLAGPNRPIDYMLRAPAADDNAEALKDLLAFVVHQSPRQELVRAADDPNKVERLFTAIIDRAEPANKVADLQEALGFVDFADQRTRDAMLVFVGNNAGGIVESPVGGAPDITVANTFERVPGMAEVAHFASYAQQMIAMPAAEVTAARVKALRMLIGGNALPRATAEALAPTAGVDDGILHRLAEGPITDDTLAIIGKFKPVNNTGLSRADFSPALNLVGAGDAVFHRIIINAHANTVPSQKLEALKFVIRWNAVDATATAILDYVKGNHDVNALKETFNSLSTRNNIRVAARNWVRAHAHEMLGGGAGLANSVASAFALSTVPLRMNDLKLAMEDIGNSSLDSATAYAFYLRNVSSNDAKNGAIASEADQRARSIVLCTVMLVGHWEIALKVADAPANIFTQAILEDIVSRARAEDQMAGNTDTMDALKALQLPNILDDGNGLNWSMREQPRATVPRPADDEAIRQAMRALFN